MKKILLISHSYPPLLTANSIQISRWVQELSRHYLFHVVSVKPAHTTDFTGLPEQRQKTVVVHQTASLERLFERCKLSSIIRRVYPPLLARPDQQALWLPFARRTIAGLIRKERFDLLISCSHYLSNHLSVLMLKEDRSLPMPPWIAHFSDPWTESIYFRPLSSGHLEWCRAIEKRITERADFLTFPSEEMRGLMSFAGRNKDAPRSTVIPHCYDRRLLEHIRSSPYFDRLMKEKRKALRLIHTGSFYGDRTPLPLFEALHDQEEFRNMEILLVGTDPSLYEGELKRRRIESMVTCIPRVSYEESLAYMLSADMLLVIDAPCSEGRSVFFPSKLADYLGTGLPITGITPGGSTSARLLESLGHRALDIHNPAAVKEGLIRALRDTHRRFTIPPEFSTEGVAEKWASLIERITSKE